MSIGVHDVIAAIDQHFQNEPFFSGQLILAMQLTRRVDIKNLYSYIVYLNNRGIIVRGEQEAKHCPYSTPSGKTAKQAHIDWLAARAKESKAPPQKRGGAKIKQAASTFLLGALFK